MYNTLYCVQQLQASCEGPVPERHEESVLEYLTVYHVLKLHWKSRV